jgi:hypothetical protein
VPDAEWKQRLTLDIVEMGNTPRVVADAALYDAWEQKQGPLSTAITSARSPSQCEKAQAAYDALRQRLGFR